MSQEIPSLREDTLLLTVIPVPGGAGGEEEETHFYPKSDPVMFVVRRSETIEPGLEDAFNFLLRPNPQLWANHSLPRPAPHLANTTNLITTESQWKEYEKDVYNHARLDCAQRLAWNFCDPNGMISLHDRRQHWPLSTCSSFSRQPLPLGTIPFGVFPTHSVVLVLQ